jgi:ElaB/YqjD/DUF883 family membrane-anchored ribosome-binding protein
MASGIADQASEFGKRAAAGAEHAKEMAQQTAAQAAEMAKSAAETLGDARDAAWDVAQKAGTQARHTAAGAYRRGERAARDIGERVEERPLAALLIAGAVGYAIAYLLHARR